MTYASQTVAISPGGTRPRDRRTRRVLAVVGIVAAVHQSHAAVPDELLEHVPAHCRAGSEIVHALEKVFGSSIVAS